MRTVRPAEEERWNELMRQHHYLGFRKLCGNRLRQIAVHGERWLGLLGWQSAALHCAARDRWIGWTSLQRQQRLFLVVNQSRFLLLSAAGQHPGLASRVLGQSFAPTAARVAAPSRRAVVVGRNRSSTRASSTAPAIGPRTGSRSGARKASGACVGAPSAISRTVFPSVCWSIRSSPTRRPSWPPSERQHTGKPTAP